MRIWSVVSWPVMALTNETSCMDSFNSRLRMLKSIYAGKVGNIRPPCGPCGWKSHRCQLESTGMYTNSFHMHTCARILINFSVTVQHWGWGEKSSNEKRRKSWRMLRELKGVARANMHPAQGTKRMSGGCFCLIACASLCCFICVILLACCVGLAALAAVVLLPVGTSSGAVGCLDNASSCCICASSSAWRMASSVSGWDSIGVLSG